VFFLRIEELDCLQDRVTQEEHKHRRGAHVEKARLSLQLGDIARMSSEIGKSPSERNPDHEERGDRGAQLFRVVGSKRGFSTCVASNVGLLKCRATVDAYFCFWGLHRLF